MSVRVWRPTGLPRIRLCHGTTASYAVDPRGEFNIGVVTGRRLLVRRGRERFEIDPGTVTVWDPGAAHRGWAVDGSWRARLLTVELPGIAELVDDAELPAAVFGPPVLPDPALARSFVRLHRALELPEPELAAAGMLAAWLDDLLRRGGQRRRIAGDDRAVRIATELLLDELSENVSLDRLAEVAGVSKFRLVRLFRAAFGAPPHAFQVGHRVMAAQRMIEGGGRPADVAVRVGFYDESHLSRHFSRRVGMTPGTYAAQFRTSGR